MLSKSALNRAGPLSGKPKGIIALCAFAATAAAISWLFHFLEQPTPNGFIQVARLTSAAFLVGVAPGALLFLAFRPRQAHFLEILSYSIGLSLAFAQLITAVSMLAHIPLSVFVSGYTILIPLLAGGLLFVVNRQPPITSTELIFDPTNVAIVIALFFIGALFYARGNEFARLFGEENLLHISIINQLMVSMSPSITNIFLVPNFVYTYPIPGIHGFYALLCLTSDLNAISVFDKMRGLWVVASLSLMFSLASIIFGSRILSRTTFWTAWLLVITGAYAGVPHYFWSQLAPSSHISDIAMNILLPADMVFLFTLAKSRTGSRQSIFFGIGFLAISATLALAHPRDLVQVLVYSGGVIIGLVAFTGLSARVIATTAWIAAAVAFSLAYRIWYQFSVPALTKLLAKGNVAFAQYVKGLSWSQFFLNPLGPAYEGGIEKFLYGAGAAMLLSLVAGVFIFRYRASVWAIGLSGLLYLLLIRFAILAIPFVYLTNDEILHVPVRNTIHFEYVFFGAMLGWLAYRLGRAQAGVQSSYEENAAFLGKNRKASDHAAMTYVRLPWGVPTRLWTLSERAAIALGLGLTFGGLSWVCNAYVVDAPNYSALTEVVLLIVIAGLVAILPLPRRRPRFWSTAGSLDAFAGGSIGFMFALLLIPIAVLTAVPVSSPLHTLTDEGIWLGLVRSERQYYSQQTALALGASAQDKCVMQKPSPALLPLLATTLLPMCAPDYELIEFINTHLPSDAVLLMNQANSSFSGLGFIKRKFALPPAGMNFREPSILFGEPYAIVQSAVRDDLSQPFFNNQPVVAEDDYAFARKIEATNVLIDPMFGRHIIPALKARPDLFTPLLNVGEWTLLKVRS